MSEFKPTGYALRLSVQQIASESVVTDLDIQRAVQLWRKLMPPRYKPMLQAKVKRGIRV